MTIATRVMMAVNSVLAGIIVARLLGAESLGQLAVLSVTISMILQFSGFGMAIANSYFTAGNKDNLGPAFINGTLFGFASGIAFAIVFIFFAPVLIPGVPAGLAAVGLISIPFTIVTQINGYLFLGQNEITRFNLIELLNQSLVLVNSLLALLILGGGLWMLVSFNTLASAAVCIFTIVFLHRFISRSTEDTKWRIDRGLFHQMIKYGVKANIAWVAIYLIYRVDLLIVSYFRGNAEASVYAVASQVTFLLLIVPFAFATLLQNRVARGDENAEFSGRVIRYASLLVFLSCVVSVPGIFILQLLYGGGFDDLPVQLWILLPGVYFAGMQIILCQCVTGDRLPLKMHTIWLIALVVNVGLNLLFVPKFGPRAAAAISTFCYALVFAAAAGIFRFEKKVGPIEILLPRMVELRSSLGELTGILAGRLK